MSKMLLILFNLLVLFMLITPVAADNVSTPLDQSSEQGFFNDLVTIGGLLGVAFVWLFVTAMEPGDGYKNLSRRPNLKRPSVKRPKSKRRKSLVASALKAGWGYYRGTKRNIKGAGRAYREVRSDYKASKTFAQGVGNKLFKRKKEGKA